MVKFTGAEDENFSKVARMLGLYYTKATSSIPIDWGDETSDRGLVHIPSQPYQPDLHFQQQTMYDMHLGLRSSKLE
ncbi:hypothetical protein CGCSCA5_v006689 [Colletotrichum siamense]|nr:hypothetical protein CGCSCA5_v006689 [Colletotrichum siamense]